MKHVQSTSSSPVTREYKALDGVGGEEARQAVARSERRQLQASLLHPKGNRGPLRHLEQGSTMIQVTLKEHCSGSRGKGGVKAERLLRKLAAVIGVIWVQRSN